MTRLLAHARRNAVAYLALFVALGGTSYAAFSLPAGSVGARQLKNGAVGASKLDPNTLAAGVRAWANILWTGTWRVQASSSDIRITPTALGEVVTWRRTRFPRNCLASVTPQVNSVPSGPNGTGSLDGYVTTAFEPQVGRLEIDGLAVSANHQAQGVSVLIFCPSTGSQNTAR